MEYRLLSQEEFNDITSRILYEDNHILIINKRVGEIVQGDKTGDEALSETLKAYIALRDSKPGRVFMGVPHRLDRPVSGISMFAKTSKGLERLNEMFRTGAVHKTYWALCCSEPSAAAMAGADSEGFVLLENWLYRNEKQNKTYIVKEGAKDAKLAKLKLRVKAHTERYHLVEVELLTGRHHQIRCQLAGLGCPIKGDLKYGAPRSNRNGGICLMARSIRFDHPIRHEEIYVEAPVPEDWPGVQA